MRIRKVPRERDDIEVTLTHAEAVDLVNYSMRVNRMLTVQIETPVSHFFDALAEATR